jgi:hypothetical protein
VILDSTHLLFPSRSLLISSLDAPAEPLDAGDLFDGMNKRAAGASGEDRLSDLPDGVLHHVLSLLPADQAVQTSVLARRWRHLWKGMPALRLVGPKTRFATAQDFDRFVNRLIAARGDLPLVSCEVEAYLTWDDYGGEPEEPEPNLYFDSWIQYALACKVQVLKVVGDVVGCESELIVPLISQHLVNLDVHHVCMEKDSVDFSSCPVLEELKMKECGLWVRSKDENGRKRSKTDLRYRKTKTVGSGYFYI